MHMRKLQRQRRESNFPPCEFGSESLPLRHTQVRFDSSCFCTSSHEAKFHKNRLFSRRFFQKTYERLLMLDSFKIASSEINVL